MVDSESTSDTYYLIVRLLSAPEMIFDMRTYEAAFAPEVEAALKPYVDIDDWGKRYEYYYNLWLDSDEDCIFNLDHAVNARMLYAVRHANAELPENTHLFYYYDIDRTDERGPEWTHCPLTGKPLVNLGDAVSFHGRLVSFDSYLAVPDIANQPTP